jgi:hypothetical protein
MCYHKEFKVGAHANGVVKIVQILERARWYIII